MQLAVMATARWVLRIEKGVALARLAHSLPGIAFEGVMSHQTLPGKPDRETRIRDGVPFMRMCLDVKDAIEAAGIPVGVVSAGETFSYDIAARLPGITEVEGGTYMLMSHSFDYMSEFRIATKVLATVISTPRPGIAIGDVGTRALGLRAWPRVEGREGLAVEALHEEHVTLRVEGEAGIELGAQFLLSSGHQDSMTDRWDHYACVRDGRVEAVWPIAARGCFH